MEPKIIRAKIASVIAGILFLSTAIFNYLQFREETSLITYLFFGVGGLALIYNGLKSSANTTQPQQKTPSIFNGRLNRIEFFLALLVSVPVLSLLSVYLVSALSFLLPRIPYFEDTYFAAFFFYFPSILSVAYFTSFAVRRMHDLNRSGSWVFWGFVPIINIGICVWLFFVAGDDVNNPYGPSAKNRRLSFRGIFLNKWAESVSARFEPTKGVAETQAQQAHLSSNNTQNQRAIILSILIGGIAIAGALYWMRSPSAAECFTREMYKWGTERGLMDDMYDLTGPDARMSVAKAKTFLKNYDLDNLNKTDERVYNAVTTMFEYCGIK